MNVIIVCKNKLVDNIVPIKIFSSKTDAENFLSEYTIFIEDFADFIKSFQGFCDMWDNYAEKATKAEKVKNKVNDIPCSCGMCESPIEHYVKTVNAMKKAESEVTKLIDSKLKKALVNVEKTSEKKVK